MSVDTSRSVQTWSTVLLGCWSQVMTTYARTVVVLVLATNMVTATLGLNTLLVAMSRKIGSIKITKRMSRWGVRKFLCRFR